MPRDDDPIPLTGDDEPADIAMTLHEIAAREAAARAKAGATAKPNLARKPSVAAIAPALSRSAHESVVPAALAFTIGFALLAALPWLIVSGAARRDIFGLEILLGIGAAIGAMRRPSIDPLIRGSFAALVTLILVFVLRWMLVTTTLLPAYTHRAKVEADRAQEQAAAEQDARDVEQRDPRAADLIAVAILKSRGINQETTDAAQFRQMVAAIQPQAIEKLRQISKPQYFALLDRLEQMDIRKELINRKMDEQLRAVGLNPDFQKIYPEQNDAAQKVVLQQVDQMTSQQQRAALAKLNQSVLDEIEFQMRRSKGEDRRAAPVEDDEPQYTRAGMLFSIGSCCCVIVAMLIAFRAGGRPT